MKPPDSRIETDGEEEREAEQHEDLPGGDDEVGECQRCGDAERSDETDVERRAAVERPAEPPELAVLGHPRCGLCLRADVIEDGLRRLLGPVSQDESARVKQLVAAPLLDRLGSLAEPQRRGLSVAFGLESLDGTPPTGSWSRWPRSA